MSLFGEFLNQMIRSREISISRLARDAGVERTAIHKALNGDRILPYPAVESLSRYLKLSPGEAKKLHQYYDLLFESEDAGRAREIVRQMVLRLSGQSFPEAEEGLDPLSCQQPCTRQDGGMYKGYGQIGRLIRFMIAEEMECDTPKVELALPPDTQVWKDCLDWLCAAVPEGGRRTGRDSAEVSGHGVEFAHIVCLDASGCGEKDDLRNLEALSCLLPGCILPGIRYHIHYYYSDRGQSQYTDPLPYFMVTRAGAVCFSPNCQAALLLRAEEQTAYFRACFSCLKKSCHLMPEYLESPEETAKAYDEIAAEEGGCAILPQPWSQKMPGKDWILLFPRKGILDFLETGRLDDPFTGEADVLTENRRDRVWGEFLDALSRRSLKGRIVNDGMFHLSRRFLMAASSGGMLLCGDGAGWGIRIREGLFWRAVRDWAVYFSDSEDVFDREETMGMLAEMGGRKEESGFMPA